MKKHRLFFNVLLAGGSALLLLACALLPTPTPLASIITTPTMEPLHVRMDASVNLDAHPGMSPIILHFSQPMDIQSSDAPLLFSPPLTGTLSWDDTQTILVFVPLTPFRALHSYTLSVDSRLAARDGQRFDLKPHWIVKAEPSPRIDAAMVYNVELVDGEEEIVSHYPSSVLRGRRPILKLTFNRAMFQESVSEALSIIPNVPHRLVWEEQTLAIQFEQPLDLDTEYFVSLSPSALDRQGSSLHHEYYWTLTTPALVERYRAPDAETPSAPISVQFNYPMDPESVETAWDFSPATAGELTWNDDMTIFTFDPSAPLPPDADFTCNFDMPLMDAFGDPLPAPPPHSFISPPPILASEPNDSGVATYAPVRITFDRLVDEESAAAALRISPPISGSISWDETALTFVPDQGHFEPWTTYTVTVLPDVSDRDGQRLLNRSYLWSFETRELEKIVSFGTGPNAQVLDADGRRAVHFTLTNNKTTEIKFELYALSVEQFLDRYASGFRGVAGREDLPISIADTTLIESWTEDFIQTTRSYYSAFETFIPADVPPGLYLLNLKADYLNDQLIMVLTRNTMMVKQAEGQIVAWVTDIAGGSSPDGAAQESVEIKVYDRGAALLGEGFTDANGVFRTEVAVDPQPLIVVARSGDDITVSGLSNEWRQIEGSRWSRWWRTAPVVQDYAAYIYTDRPIYRPGQSVYFKSIVRSDDDALLDVLPSGTALLARIRDSRNNVVQTFELTTNDFGSVFGEFVIAEGAMLGDYAVEIVLDSEVHRQEFKVEDYRKPDYQVSVIPDQIAYVEGEQISITIDTAYFFGEPVPNAKIEVNRFHLGQRYYSYWDEPGEEEYIWYRDYDLLYSGRTDDQGRYTFSIKASLGNHSYEYWHSNLERTLWGIEATVDDGSHQSVSGFAVYRVFNTAEQLKVTSHGRVHKPNESFTLETTVMDIYDAPVADRELSLTLRRWNRESRKYDQIIQELPMTTDDEGVARLSMAVEEPGFYRIWVDGEDHLGNPLTYRTYVYVFSDERYANWLGQGETLVISSDLSSYAPGDVAKLIIESDFDGPALLTFERGTTRREEVVELTSPLTLIEVPILAEDIPNIYVSVNAWMEADTTLGENDYYSKSDSDLLMAQINLSVPATEKMLNVSIIPDKTTYAPRDEASFTLRVSDHQGNPVVAEVSLAMVDEAIFALSEDLSVPIGDAFYQERENIVRTYHSLALRRELFVNGRGGGGGDGTYQGNPRSDFPDTAAWFPVLLTDANGEAQISLILPDSLTSWRLTAKASTVDTQVGESSVNVITKQDVIVRPILPRVLTSGDALALSAIVHNYMETTQTLKISMAISTSEGLEPLLSIDRPATQTLSLGPDALAVVGWTAQADHAGEAQILVQAVVGEQVKDAIVLPLNVQPLAVPDVTTEIGQISEVLQTTVTMPDEALALSSVQIDLSRSIAGTLLEGLEYLTGFPYGCVEQTMSKALPNAVIGRAINKLGVSAPTLEAELPPKIHASVQRLYGYQHNDGGWGWWFDDSTDAYQTAWVVFGLATTLEAGYEIDPLVIQRGVTWINEHLETMDPRTAAYAVYSLAVAGSPNLTATLEFADKADTLDVFSQAGLALALYESGESDAAGAIVDRLAESAQRRAGMVYWASDADHDGHYSRKTMSSATRSTALALSAFVKTRPGHELEPGIVRWLLSQRKQAGWGSTNETSFSIIALTDHLLATSFNEAAVQMNYAVKLNGEEIATGNLGRGEPAVSLVFPAAYFENGENQLEITHNSDNPLYYVINQRVYLAQDAIEAAGNVSIERSYLDPEENTPLEEVVPGQLVRVQLKVTMLEKNNYVIVEDYLPGGLEALNTQLNTSTHVGSDEPSYYWMDYGYNYKEVRGDRVSFFVTEMDVGLHVFTYMARATHAGDFVVLPTEVSAMYNFLTWGRSESSTLHIAE